MGVEGAQCVYSLAIGEAALAMGAEVSESPPEERLATVVRRLRLFSWLHFSGSLFVSAPT